MKSANDQAFLAWPEVTADTKSNSSEALIATLASPVMGNLKAVWSHGVMMKLLACSHAVFQGGRNNLFDIWKRLCFTCSCESLGMVRRPLQNSSLDCCNSCSSGWMQKLPVADLAKSCQYHQEQIHHVCCANDICSFRVFLVRIHVSDWKLESLWEPGILLP